MRDTENQPIEETISLLTCTSLFVWSKNFLIFFCDRFFPYKMSPSLRAKKTTSCSFARAAVKYLVRNICRRFPKQDALKCVKFLKRWQIIGGVGSI